MPVNPSRVKSLIDVADTVLLRNIADGAETSTATETAVSLNELDSAYWHGGDIPYGILQVVINVTANDSTTGDETCTLALFVDDTSGLSDTPVAVWSQALTIGFTGTLYAYVDARNIPALNADTSGTDKWMGIRATLAGTTPSITYGAYLVKSIKT